MRFHFLCCLVLIAHNLLGQRNVDANESKTKFFVLTGIARSVFEVDIPASKFATPEFRLGAGLSRTIGKFEIKPSVLIGLKATRPTYRVGQVYTQPGVPLLMLDDAASGRNHFVIDVPLVIQYNLRNPMIGFRLGFDVRFWTPNNKNVDILTAKQEIGLHGGGCINLKGFSVGLDFYYGFTKIHGGGINYNGDHYIFRVVNAYTQITFEFPL